jgi:HEPN domain-containing protein
MNQPDNKNLILAQEWFARANDDELSAKDILKDREGSPNTVCFLSQQIAEKFLKSFLVFKIKRFPKVHQLEKLINLCNKIDDQFESIKEDAKYLSEFYISTRYPGDYPQFTFKDAEIAFKKAMKIKNFVLVKIIGK